MLINISNHPVSTWSTPQIDMAKSVWGDISDIALPNIDPYIDGKEVKQMAQRDCLQYINTINQYAAPSAFHIMGESVYCFHLIQELKERGYAVVASTTLRDVIYKDGNKISNFKFVRFREY